MNALSTRRPQLRGIVVALMATGVYTAAHAQQPIWISQFGSDMHDEARALAPDGVGGVMVAGFTNGVMGGPNAGDDDVFLIRCDSAGDQLWMRQFGSVEFDCAEALAPDSFGGVIVAGSTFGALGAASLGQMDAFISRYNQAGDRLWLHQFGTPGHDEANAIAPDGNGGVVVAGGTDQALGGPLVGGWDAYLSHFDGAGHTSWSAQLGTSADDWARALAPDGKGGMFVAGWTQGDVGGPSAGHSDAFIALYNGFGDRTWVRQFGSSGYDRAWALASDDAGGAFIGGTTGDDLFATNVGRSDIFIARYDSNGDQFWGIQLGTPGFDELWALTPDGSGGVLVAGNSSGNLGGPHLGSADAFVARYDADGNQLWVTQFGTPSSDGALAITRDSASGIKIAGWTYGSLGAPNPGGRSDALLARYADSCYADCDKSTGVGVLDIFDFLCFQNSFVNGETYACACDTSTGPGVCDVFDFLCFQDAFIGGCP